MRRRLFRARHVARQGRTERRPDLHGLHARRLHRLLQQAVRVRQQAHRHAQPRRARKGLARVQDGGARGDAHGAGPARPPDWRALVPVPELRPHAGPARRPGLDLDTGQPADRDRGPRRGRRRDRLLHRQPLPRRAALRELPPHARLREAELLPGRVPLPQQAVQAPGAAERDRALPAARAERLGRGGPAPLDGRLELDLPRLRPRLPHGARLPQRHQPRRRPEEEAPLLPRRRRLRPARAAGRAEGVPGPVRRPEGHREDAWDHAHPAVRDALFVGDRHEARPGRRSSGCGSCTRPRSPSRTSGSAA